MTTQRKLISVDDAETLGLVVRNIDGNGVLFTHDGKLVGHQVERVSTGDLCPHYYYDGPKHDRVMMFRATFIVDTMEDKAPGND